MRSDAKGARSNGLSLPSMPADVAALAPARRAPEKMRMRLPPTTSPRSSASPALRSSSPGLQRKKL
nr:MAG: hypothetical protein [Molluscum contagiosum virus]